MTLAGPRRRGRPRTLRPGTAPPHLTFAADELPQLRPGPPDGLLQARTVCQGSASLIAPGSAKVIAILGTFSSVVLSTLRFASWLGQGDHFQRASAGATFFLRLAGGGFRYESPVMIST